MSEGLPFRAIADSTRRQILDLLRDSGPLRAGDIAAQFDDMTRIAVSKHLRILKEAELVQLVESGDGRERLYALNDAGLSEVRSWLQSYDAFWRRRLERLKQIAEEPSEDRD